MELSQVSGRITRRLGKELGKKSDDDYAHWTNVLDSLDIELSTEEEEKIGTCLNRFKRSGGSSWLSRMPV